MESDLSPREEPREEAEASEKAPPPKMSYGRVIVQLVLILPCAALLFPTLIFGIIELADAFRPTPSRGLLSSGMMYGLGFGCVVCGIFLPDHFSWRWAGVLITVVGLPLFLAGAMDMSAKLRIFGAGREVYEILVMFTGPVVVTVWNAIRLWRSRVVEEAAE